jgi:hypothetical protein
LDKALPSHLAGNASVRHLKNNIDRLETDFERLNILFKFHNIESLKNQLGLYRQL